jgi:hypothetical protein
MAGDAFRDRSAFLGRLSIATVEKSRLAVNEPPQGADELALGDGVEKSTSFSLVASWVPLAPA